MRVEPIFTIREAQLAIKTLRDGVWDNPLLKKVGPLYTNTEQNERLIYSLIKE